MKNITLLIAPLCGLLWCTSAEAQSVTTKTSTWACSESCTQTTSALNPFDSNLGTLTGITLNVDGLKDGYYTDYPGGSAVLSYDGVMSVIVNGVTYSFNITGAEEDLLVPEDGPANGTFTATGSAKFTIDQALFSTFIGTENSCGSFPMTSIPTGICVTAAGNGMGLSTNDIVRSDSGAHVNVIDGDVKADYTLTYFYVPIGAVPEPAAWMLMILGFGAIGLVARRSQHARVPVA